MNVFFSAEAEKQLEELAAYLGERWSQRVKTDFLALVADKLALIGQMPEMYRRSEKRPGLRECVVNKRAILYYRIEMDEIEIVAFLSTRQDSDQ
ncbi:MAG: type II toxin-antitoxin system RelE/ParE family toxin [Spirosoma sp.]|nr:type II toxin-antitoxin system RelE/ParE family toxin [Spirosoma sp.]